MVLTYESWCLETRTRPGTFEGNREAQWISDIKEELDVQFAVEVATQIILTYPQDGTDILGLEQTTVIPFCPRNCRLCKRY